MAGTADPAPQRDRHRKFPVATSIDARGVVRRNLHSPVVAFGAPLLILASLLQQQAPPPGGAGAAPPAVEPVIEPPPQPIVTVQARRVILGTGRVLLPEGTYFRRSPGRLLPRPEGDEGRGLRFLPDDFGDDPKAAIPLAPSPALEDGESLFAAGPVEGDALGQSVTVELSGEVLSYRGRNWILADFIVPLRGLPAHSPDGNDVDIPVDAADRVAGAASEQDVIGAQTDSNERDLAADLERRLRQRLGPVGRSLKAGTASGVDGEAASAPTLAAAAERLREPERLIRRRGTVIRDNDTGGWRFVPVSQDGGSPDPPMRILASAIVENLERTVRAADGPKALLLTGRVTTYRGETWLRLATFEIPRAGASLRPGGVAGQ